MDIRFTGNPLCLKMIYVPSPCDRLFHPPFLIQMEIFYGLSSLWRLLCLLVRHGNKKGYNLFDVERLHRT